jgi:hypothetical protein
MAFDANLPNLDRKVRINSFYDAQVFVRRWAIRDKDRAIRALLRRMESANSSETANSALEELINFNLPPPAVASADNTRANCYFPLLLSLFLPSLANELFSRL